MRIAVLMSTYNGENYIEKQIDSILKQEDVAVDLYIRDDGSTDSTRKKLWVYKDKVKIFWGKNIGVGSSFMWLVYNVPTVYDYYAFSDQDDIWFPNKLAKAVQFINSSNKKDVPLLYASNQIVVNSRGEKIDIRYECDPDVTYKQILCQNKISGCTMVWDNKLQKLLKEENRIPSTELLHKRIHDVWVGMVAATIGEVIFDSKAYIYYRQHENNVVGVKKTNIWKEWIKKIKDPSLRRGRSSLCREIYKCYGDLIENSIIKNDLKCFANYQESKKLKHKLLCNDTLIKYTGESKWLFRLKVYMGLF